MSNALLFTIGSFVTLLVSGALGLLVYAAVLDGRYAREERLREARRSAEREPSTGPGHAA